MWDVPELGQVCMAHVYSLSKNEGEYEDTESTNMFCKKLDEARMG